MKGLLVFVLRDAEGKDYTNGGISSRRTRFVLTGEGVPEIFEPDEKAPELRLVRRFICGEEYLHAEPVDGKDPNQVGWMFGGNFIETSDSRFPNRYPIPVHDRQDTQEVYDMLTR